MLAHRIIPTILMKRRIQVKGMGFLSDRVVGNAAALLLKEASCSEVYGLIGSRLAAQTLEELCISHSFLKTVPYIVNRYGNDMCPFEKASLGKSPAEFYELAKERLTSAET